MFAKSSSSGRDRSASHARARSWMIGRFAVLLIAGAGGLGAGRVMLGADPLATAPTTRGLTTSPDGDLALIQRDVHSLKDEELLNAAHEAIAAGVRHHEVVPFSEGQANRATGSKFCEYALQCFREARARFQKADDKSIDPKQKAMVLAEGAWWTLQVTGNVQPAYDELQKALGLDKAPRIYVMLAFVALRTPQDLQARFDEGLDYVNKALKLAPNSADAHFIKSQILALEHNVPDATQELQAYVKEAEAGHTDPLINFDPERLVARIKLVKDMLAGASTSATQPAK